MLGLQSAGYLSLIPVEDIYNSDIFAVLFLAITFLAVISTIAMWKIFAKAGVDSWKAIIPIYNYMTLCEIVGKPSWWGLIPVLMLIPIINFIAWVPALILAVIVALELGRAFGKSTIWSIFLLLIFSVIGYLILGFGPYKFDSTKLATNVYK